MAKAARPNELRLVRLFDAPLKMVWDAWTKDEHIGKWWGPRGFTLTTKSKEVRVGGKWVYTMHGPDGVDYPNIATYHVVDPYSRLSYDHGATEDREALFRVTVTFAEMNGKTQMDMTMSFASAEAAREIKKFIKQAGGDSTWDRFSEYLIAKQTKNDLFVINRSFETDSKTMFEMWTNPKHLGQWMGPSGSKTSWIKTDIREGASSQYAMTNADGETMYGVLQYKTIQPYELLVYTQSFCDKEGRICKPPFAPSWPDTMLTVVSFHKEGEQETRVTLKWEVYGDATETERSTFQQAKDGMSIGWTGSFDKLEEHLHANAPKA